jgi:hypothetical protein
MLAGEGVMILVREIFQLKFGKAKEAVALWKEGLALMKHAGIDVSSTRLLTDVVGPYYTLVMESTFASLADFEKQTKSHMNDAEWRAWYPKVIALTESGRREIFTIVE